MSVRQYKIHTNLDGEGNITFDVTNGKLRFYAPRNLGVTITNNIWSANGIGVKGNSNIVQPSITFGVETFGESLQENYDLLSNFIQTVMSVNFVTLEYTTDNFTVYADIALSEQTKTEGYGKNGTFSETITFEPITKWYTFEKLAFTTAENGEFLQNTSKIYGQKRNINGADQAINGYTYTNTPVPSYAYFGEDNITRFSRWNIDAGIFSFTATMTPLVNSSMKFGLSFLDENFNEYTAIVLKMSSMPQSIQINTDINDEYYNAVIGSNVINQFPALDFERFRTRVFEKGTMALINVKDVEMSIKKKVDFI